MLLRTIPSSQESLSVIGIGTWQTFDVPDATNNTALPNVLQVLHQAGGRLIDTSPMYGNAEAVIGSLAGKSGNAADYFYATKVWTTGREQGIRQMNESFQKLGTRTIDLMQIHNLVDWKTQIRTLRAWKEEGRIRYIGITHYTDDSHGLLERIISEEPLDFVQFNYSIFSRHAEQRLLPAAAAHGVATLINRPLGEGRVFEKVKGKILPQWALDYGIENWSSFFLKFIVAHPAVTCVIPATSNSAHMTQNISAGSGLIPDEALRLRMADLVATL